MGHPPQGPVPNLLDNKEVFLHACATVAFALRAVADAVRTRTEKLPHYRVHSVVRMCAVVPYNSRIIKLPLTSGKPKTG
jgi:hypothetical protein